MCFLFTASYDSRRSLSRSLSEEESGISKTMELNPEIKSKIDKRVNKEKDHGPAIQTDFVRLLEGIALTGLEEKEKEDIIQKFPSPENCLLIEPPKLNLEVKNSLPEASKATIINRDSRIIKIQEKIAACMTTAVTVLDKYSKFNEPDEESLNTLNDLCSLLADLQHDESVIRKSIILANVKSTMRNSLLTTKIDEHLFSSNLNEVIKSAKDLENSSKEQKKEKNFNKNNSKNFKSPPRQRTYYNPSTRGGWKQNSSHRKNSSRSETHRSRKSSNHHRRR